MDETKIGFWTGANYLKRLTTAQSSQAYSLGAGATSTITVNHNLGHIPGDWHVGLEISGTIWSNTQPWNGMDGAGGTQTAVSFDTWTTDNVLTITLFNPTGSTKSGTVYWTVFMDYDV